MIRTRMCVYQGVRNVSFSENFAYVLNGWPVKHHFMKISMIMVVKMLPFGQIPVKSH